MKNAQINNISRTMPSGGGFFRLEALHSCFILVENHQQTIYTTFELENQILKNGPKASAEFFMVGCSMFTSYRE